jgi:type I site-specific restriction-modification system R (restriction) subunit
MHQLIKPLILILFLTASLTSFASGRTVPLEGYNWYNEKSEGKQEKPVDRKESSNKFVQQEPELPEYEKNIRSLQEEHNQAHRKALDNPTIENILAELRLEKEMLRKSQLYGQRRVAMQVAMQRQAQARQRIDQIWKEYEKNDQEIAIAQRKYQESVDYWNYTGSRIYPKNSPGYLNEWQKVQIWDDRQRELWQVRQDLHAEALKLNREVQ